MKLDQETIDRINNKLKEAETIRYGEIHVRFIRHQGEWVKIAIEKVDYRREILFKKKTTK